MRTPDDVWICGDDGVEFVGTITNEETLLLMEKIKEILEQDKPLRIENLEV